MRKHPNKKKKNMIAAAATTITFLMLAATIVVIMAGPVTMIGINQPAKAAVTETTTEKTCSPTVDCPFKAPSVVSGDNIYIAWWTNNTKNGNQEVMFRASNDGGATFGDKINLSNTPDADSTRVEIAGEGATVVVSWWETNQTSDIPVARISTDGGETFGAMLRLGMNGTLSNTEEGGGEGEGGETTEEEEAVGGAEVAE